MTELLQAYNENIVLVLALVIIFSWIYCLTRTLLIKVQKQSELLLNADDLDAMWVCLRENCVIDDATGAEKVCMSDFFSSLLGHYMLLF